MWAGVCPTEAVEDAVPAAAGAWLGSSSPGCGPPSWLPAARPPCESPVSSSRRCVPPDDRFAAGGDVPSPGVRDAEAGPASLSGSAAGLQRHTRALPREHPPTCAPRSPMQCPGSLPRTSSSPPPRPRKACPGHGAHRGCRKQEVLLMAISPGVRGNRRLARLPVVRAHAHACSTKDKQTGCCIKDGAR